MAWHTWLYGAAAPTHLSWHSLNFNCGFWLCHSPVGHWGEAEEGPPSACTGTDPLGVLWQRLTHRHWPHIPPCGILPRPSPGENRSRDKPGGQCRGKTLSRDATNHPPPRSALPHDHACQRGSAADLGAAPGAAGAIAGAGSLGVFGRGRSPLT